MIALLRFRLATALIVLLLGACSTLPPQLLTPREELEPEAVPAPTMLVEYPPIEPVEPQLPEPDPPQVAAAASDTGKLAMIAPAAVIRPAPAPPEPNLDDQQFLALLGIGGAFFTIALARFRKTISEMA